MIDASEDEYGNLRLSLGDYLEGPGLLVFELYKRFVIFDNLLAFAFTAAATGINFSEDLNSFGSANHCPAI
jgi:hypothetical protein